jgi:hypothetical protein
MFVPLLALAACATPRTQCIDDVTRDTRILSALIAETQANLARGYAIDRRQDVRTVTRTCSGRTDTGERFFFPCAETDTFTTNVPVAIDLNVERAKLVSLQQRMATTQAASNAAVAQCIAIHPE